MVRRDIVDILVIAQDIFEQLSEIQIQGKAYTKRYDLVHLQDLQHNSEILADCRNRYFSDKLVPHQGTEVPIFRK